MKTSLIAVIDYGAGNLASVQNVLRHLGAEFFVTSRPEEVASAGSLIFPGDGEAAASMSELRRTGMDEALRSFHASGRKMLGICIGCQVIFTHSDERDTPCLGLIPGEVRRFVTAPGMKVPHMGWNTVRFSVDHPVFSGLPQDSSFYFIHSYYPVPSRGAHVAGTTEYGLEFASAVAADNLVAVQFHPEKSGRVGLRLLSNYIAWDGCRQEDIREPLRA
ncbi:MAG TPA: imidazole glycerol phosphate synthase subunit HisH [Spirochaetia bacterium]|nr:imidazole glycerol phosphate synthase subunit HisH [Spirochaetia bacterium]